MTRAEHEDPVERVLESMTERVAALPRMAAEWERASADFLTPDPESAVRFREWFLLERHSPTLGAVPVVAWAEDLDPAWAEPLQDSLLGVLRPVGSADEGIWSLLDLWTGRALSIERPGDWDLDRDDLLILGRFVSLGTGLYRPLPGVALLSSPGLIEAVEADLDAARHEKRLASLSQLEMERAFFAKADPASAETRLEALLAEQAPGWSLQRIEAALREGGQGELLDRLAFETEIDLDAFRRLLPELTIGSPDPLQEEPTADIPGAVAAFESARSEGAELAASFAALEQALGLEVGSSELNEVELGSAEGPVAGQEEPPPIDLWFASYRWERGERSAEEDSILDRLRTFLAQRTPRLEMRDLMPALLVSFLLSRPLAAAPWREAWAQLRPFVDWAIAEQESPLEALVADLDGRLGARLDVVVATNRVLGGEPGRDVARLAATSPPRVSGDGGALIPLDGIPNDGLASLEEGDLLSGDWADGRFAVAQWIPREALPPDE